MDVRETHRRVPSVPQWDRTSNPVTCPEQGLNLYRTAPSQLSHTGQGFEGGFIINFIFQMK